MPAHETMHSVAALVGLPLERYREARAGQAIAYDQAHKSWNVHRYADAVRILNDPATFSSAPRPDAGVTLPSIVGMDGQRHRKLRGLVSQAFTPRMVEQMAPRIAAVAIELLATAQRDGGFDLMRDFAYPLPIRIIAEILGIPVEDQSTFRRWSETLVAGPRTDALRGRSNADERAAALEELQDYFGQQLALRRRAPGSDLISRLLAAEVDGERLSEGELLEFCRLLLIAGYETTACQIGTGALVLLELPAVAAELRGDPALIPGAVEEVVRCFPSVAATVRLATADVEVGGQAIARGQSVIMWNGSTNYDETVFADPETFLPRRSPNKHLGFGLGPHFCLGAPLARLEVRVALSQLLERFPRMQRDQARPVEPVDSPFLLGVKSLHVAV